MIHETKSELRDGRVRGGSYAVFEGGKVFEKAGVHVSVVDTVLDSKVPRL